jgi:hypothetical protein
MGMRAMKGLRSVARQGRSGERGQGTVEYVALILLIAGVLAAVVAAGQSMDGAGIAEAIVGKLKDSIESVGGG